MSSRVVKVADISAYIGKRVSGEHNAGWGDYWWFSGTLLAVDVTEQYTYLEICECGTGDLCEGLDTHGGLGFWPEDTVNVHF